MLQLNAVCVLKLCTFPIKAASHIKEFYIILFYIYIYCIIISVSCVQTRCHVIHAVILLHVSSVTRALACFVQAEMGAWCAKNHWTMDPCAKTS